VRSVTLSMLGTSSWSFLIRSLIFVLRTWMAIIGQRDRGVSQLLNCGLIFKQGSSLTRSAMLRGCVAHPRLARILQGTASWNWRNFSMAAISDDVLGRLNCCVRPLCTADQSSSLDML
jgi:hypothetical protein